MVTIKNLDGKVIYQNENLDNLQGADLQLANFYKAILCNANLDGAKISYRNNTIVIKFKGI